MSYQQKELISQTNQFLETTRQSHTSFMTKAEQMLIDKCDETTTKLDQILQEYKQQFVETVEKVDKCNEKVDDMAMRYEAEYQEFFRERKRWKSDFKTASDKAVSNFNSINGALQQTLKENAINSNAVKFMLDAVMIDQLIFRQDIQDRKSITAMGLKSVHELATEVDPQARAGDEP
jgi:AAA15 family ATPase/GTPase